MATLGKPNIDTPRSLELRVVAQAIGNIRQRIEAIEAQTSTVVAQAGETTLRSGQQNISITALRTQLAALAARVDALAVADAELETFRAGSAIAANTAVYPSGDGLVSQVDPGDPLKVYAVLGVATQTAVEGANVVVRKAGVMQIADAVFEPGGPVYVGISGLTQHPDYINLAIPVGVAVSADEIDVRPGWPALQYPGVYSEYETFLPATWGLVRDAVTLADDFNSAANGIAVRTGEDDITTRSIAPGFGITVADGDGVGGDPTVTLDVGISPTWTGTHTFPTITFNAQSVAPGAHTLYTDDGTTYEANTLVWEDPAIFLGEVGFGDPGSEQSSITVNGSSFDALVKINEFGGTRDASLVLHRHSDTAGVSAALGFARARGTTSTHSDVQSGDAIADFTFVAWNTNSYYRAARIQVEVDGTPGVSDMPGRIVLSTTADGSASPTERLRIANTGAFGLSGANYGSTGQVLTSAGSGSAPTWATPAGGITGLANPSANVGLTAVNGAATTAMRSDAAPALDVGISPTWTGNHTFNNAVGIGDVPIGKLDVVGSTGTYLRVRSSNSGSDAGVGLQTGSTGTSITDGFWFLVDGTAATVWQYENNFMRFGTNSIERLRIGADGVVWVVADNQELQIGAGNDLRLYHDGTDSIIENDTGNLILRVGGELSIDEVTTTTTAPAAGGAGALPATPAGYMTLIINGTSRQVAYY